MHILLHCSRTLKKRRLLRVYTLYSLKYWQELNLGQNCYVYLQQYLIWRFGIRTIFPRSDAVATIFLLKLAAIIQGATTKTFIVLLHACMSRSTLNLLPTILLVVFSASSTAVSSYSKPPV